MNNQPQQINPDSGVWYLNINYIPPNRLRVLCCDREGNIWVDHYDNEDGWLTLNDLFAWQLPSRPMDLFYDL